MRGFFIYKRILIKSLKGGQNFKNVDTCLREYSP